MRNLQLVLLPPAFSFAALLSSCASSRIEPGLHAGAPDLTAAQEKSTSNNKGKWSENTLSQISVCDTDKPWQRTRSNVCPCSCVGPDTHYSKLKESIRCKKSFTNGLSGQHTWMLKSPKRRTRSYLGKLSARRSEKSFTKSCIVFRRSVDDGTQHWVGATHLKYICFKAGKWGWDSVLLTFKIILINSGHSSSMTWWPWEVQIRTASS